MFEIGGLRNEACLFFEFRKLCSGEFDCHNLRFFIFNTFMFSPNSFRCKDRLRFIRFNRITRFNLFEDGEVIFLRHNAARGKKVRCQTVLPRPDRYSERGRLSTSSDV